MILRSLAVVIVLAAPAAAEVSPYCRAAHGKYLALFHEKEWNVEAYKAFIARFNEVSRKVDVTVSETRPIAVALALESWCETYKHADRRGAEGWEGVYQQFKRERDTYLVGRELAARQFGVLSPMDSDARKKELERKVDAKAYFPGEMGKENKLTVRDILYVFLGPDATAAVSAAATPREEVAQVAARTQAIQPDFFLRDAVASAPELPPPAFVPALPGLQAVPDGLTPPPVPEGITPPPARPKPGSQSTAPAASARPAPPAPRPSPGEPPNAADAAPENVGGAGPNAPEPAPAMPARPVAAGTPKSADPLAMLGMPQKSIVTGARFTFAAAGAEDKDLVYAAQTASPAGSVDRVRLRYDGNGKAIRWIKWGEGSGLFGAYWGYTAMPGHSDRDLTQADAIELLSGGLVRAAVATTVPSANGGTMRVGAQPVCLDLLSGRKTACPAAGEKGGEILSLPVPWGTEIKSLDGRLLEVQWKAASDGGGSFLRLKAGARSIGSYSAGYRLAAGTTFVLKRADQPAKRYFTDRGMEWEKSWAPSEEQVASQAMEVPAALAGIGVSSPTIRVVAP